MKSLMRRTFALGISASCLAAASPSHAGPPAAARQQIPSGQFVTPLAVRGAVQQLLNPGLAAYPDFVAGEAVRSQLSPDGQTLAILCAGQNSLYKTDGTVDTAASTQWIFLYDVAGVRRNAPVLKQVIPQVNAHVGLVFAPDGQTLYAAGGKDDVVYAYVLDGGTWKLGKTIALGHGGKGLGIGVAPNASGLGISRDGRTLVVANNYNDSISIIDTATGTVRYEHDLRPYAGNNEGTSGAPGGTYPFAVVVKGNGTAYVSSDRNREVIAVDISGAAAGKLVKRIKLDGNALGMTLDASGARLYVAQDNADQVAVIDTGCNDVVARIDARGPAELWKERDGRPRRGDDDRRDDDRRDDDRAGRGGRGPRYTGAATFSVTLSPDGRTLYAVNAGANALAVIPLHGEGAYRVKGLVPTAYEPHDVTFSRDGRAMYIVNGKSVTGPNPQHLASATGSITSIAYPGGSAAAAAASRASNQYQFQLERASLVTAPVPEAWELEGLTRKVAENNFYDDRDRWADWQDNEVMELLRRRIKHVIYVVKENRTFDQILGDLKNGANVDPTITQFGEALTPNFHRLAREFVTLDNFMDPGDGSMDGWSWTLQGRVTNTETITQQINYAAVSRGLSYESEGTNRNVPVNFATVAERDAASGVAGTTSFSTATAALPGGPENVLAGRANHASSDAPFEDEGGYIFSAVLAAGGTVRNYGFLVNNVGSIGTKDAPVINPFAAGIAQVAPLEPSLAPFTDVYFRGYDQNYPDLWRYDEWKRELDGFVAQKNLPSLSLVRLSHDHMGAFGTALGGVNTPETQQADDDLAVGRMVQAVAESPFADSTLFIITEDDCQDGPDHVDSHRATAYVVGPYVKKGAVVSTRYSQVNALRTIEDILGTPHINLNTAYQRPMTEVFDVRASGRWSFVAEASTVLAGTSLAKGPEGQGLGVRFAKGPVIKPKHDAAYWAKATTGLDFSDADRVPPGRFNRIVWKGLKDGRRYPAHLITSQRGRDERRDEDRAEATARAEPPQRARR